MSLTPTTQALLAWPYRLLRTELGRRVAAAMLVSATLATTVQTLYANADPPVASAVAERRADQLGGAAVAGLGGPTGKATGKATGTTSGTAPGQASRPTSRTRASAAGDPAKAAIAWYASKRGVAPAKVKLLQQRRKNDNEVRVLLLVELGDRVDTVDVKVRRAKTGWKVP